MTRRALEVFAAEGRHKPKAGHRHRHARDLDDPAAWIERLYRVDAGGHRLDVIVRTTFEERDLAPVLPARQKDAPVGRKRCSITRRQRGVPLDDECELV